MRNNLLKWPLHLTVGAPGRGTYCHQILNTRGGEKSVLVSFGQVVFKLTLGRCTPDHEIFAPWVATWRGFSKQTPNMHFQMDDIFGLKVATRRVTPK